MLNENSLLINGDQKHHNSWSIERMMIKKTELTYINVTKYIIDNSLAYRKNHYIII